MRFEEVMRGGKGGVDVLGLVFGLGGGGNYLFGYSIDSRSTLASCIYAKCAH